MSFAKSWLGALAAASLAAGCINVDVGLGSGTPPTDRFHVIDPVAPPTAPQAKKGPTLAVRTLRTRDRFTRHVVQRDGSGTVVSLDHEYWADEPSAAVSDGLREALSGSGVFSSVADASEGLDTRLVVGGQVLEFCVDGGGAPTPPAAAPTPPAGGAKPASPAPAPAPAASGTSARVRIRLTVADAKSGEVLHSGAFEAAEPLPGGDLSKLGPAMGRALSRCVQDAVTAWTTAGVAAPR